MFPPNSSWTLLVILAGILSHDTEAMAQNPRDSVDSVGKTRIGKLILQLGNESFEAREQASRELLTLGLDARDAITRALTNPDLEIRRRCRELLPEIDFQFCLARAQQIIGDSEQARDLFRLMYGVENELWYALASGAPDLAERYSTRCRDLLEGPDIRNRPPGGALRLRFMNLVTSPRRSGYIPCFLLVRRHEIKSPRRHSSRPRSSLQSNGGDGMPETPPLLRKSYVTWAEQIASLPIEYQGDQQLERARRILAAADVPARDRQYQLLIVARANDRRDDALIQGFLRDNSVCDTLFVKGVKTQIRLCDVALAAVIYRAGKDPRDFGFTKLRLDDNFLYSPSSLGFSEEAQRAEAFRNWTTSMSSP